jgi:drug/metabolite transporter (DMT)-like permease
MAVPARGAAWTGRLAACTAVVLWGVSFVATKIALLDVSPATLIFSRFALAVVVLGLLLRLRSQPFLPPRGSWPALVLMGFVGVFVHQMLQAHGLARTTATRTGWLIGLIPIWSAVLAALVLGERFGPRKLLGLVLGAAGAVVIVTRGELSTDALALPTTTGDLLILASTLNWAIYTVIGRAALARLGSLRATAASVVAGWLMLAPPFFAAGGWHELTRVSAPGVAAIVFLGVGCSGLGYLLWYAALERIETSQVAAFLYVEPLVTLVAAALLLHEPVTLATCVGGLLVLAGVATIQKAGNRA